MAGINTEVLNMRITPELKTTLERYATEQGLSIAASVRILLGNALRTAAKNRQSG